MPTSNPEGPGARFAFNQATIFCSLQLYQHNQQFWQLSEYYGKTFYDFGTFFNTWLLSIFKPILPAIAIRRHTAVRISSMLQPPSSLLEMASLRLPDSDNFDLERRPTNGHQSATEISTSSSGLTVAGDLKNVIAAKTEIFTEYFNGSMQDLFILSNTRRPSSFNGLDINDNENYLTINGIFNETNNGTNNLSIEQLRERWYRHSVAMSIVYFVAYCLVFVVGLIGNSFVIAVVYRSPRMRTVTNFFIVNLAVADVLVIVFCLPATLMSNIFVRKYYNYT
jgi:hypothetical protein